MKSDPCSFLRIMAVSAVIISSMPLLYAADVVLYTGTYTNARTDNNGTINGPVTLDSGANYAFDSLNLPLAWNRVILNSGAALNVGGNVTVDFSGLSLNGGTLTAGGLLLHDSPNWAGSINDGKQSIEQGDSIINGSTIVADQSNANFISFIGSTSTPVWDVYLANNLWLGDDGVTIDSNGNNIGITMAMGNFSGQTGRLTKTGAGTLTLSANNSYSGGTTVNVGVLEISGSSAGNGYIRGTVTVNSGAELRYTGGDGTGFGFNGGNRLETININGGLVNSQGGMTHLWGATVNMTGGEMRVNGGTSSPTGDRIEWFQSTVNTSASANTATISGRVNLRGDGGGQIAVFNVADGDAPTDLLVNAAVTESFGSVGITKNGAGNMELTGINSYTGTTTVNDGTLALTNPVLADVATVVIATNGKMALNFSGNDTVGSLEINGSGSLPPGTYSATQGGYESYFTGGGSLVVASANGTWTSLSSGNWSTASNWADNTIAAGYDATSTFDAATGVTVTVDSNRKIGNLAFDVSDYTIDGSSSLVLDSSSTPAISVSNGRTATISANLAGTHGLQKTGTGTLVFVGAKSYNGGTTVTSGMLELQGATGGDAQIHGSVTIDPGATVAFTGGDGTGFGFSNNPVTSTTVNGGTLNAVSGSHLGFGPYQTMTLSNGGSVQGNWQWNGDGLLSFSSFGDMTNTIGGNLVLRADAGAGHTFNVDDGASAIDLQIDANLSDQWPEYQSVSASGLTKAGTGTLVLNGANTFDGNTVVNAGALEVSTSGSLRFRPTDNGATNSVSGTATLSFLGTVNLDLGAAVATNGNAWNLFNLGSFSSATLSPAAVTSTLGAFSAVSATVWELPVTNAKWVFNAGNGTLSYVNTATDYDNWVNSFSPPVGASGDDDGDGVNNFDEYAFGLDPKNPASANPITLQLDKNAGTFSYQRRKSSLATNLAYTVQTSTDLATWIPDASANQSATDIPSSDNETVVVTLSAARPLTSGKLFVRVVATSAAP